MMNFLWPWAFILLPLPFFFRLILPRATQGNDASLKVHDITDFQLQDSASLIHHKKRWPLLLYTLAWICLIIAAARPQWTGDAIELPVSGRDLMMAIDISKSMDLPIRHNLRSVSRITATKAVASAFIEKRVGDRIGLSPLTFDRTTVNILLHEAVTGLAGQATAIGDAIGLAVKRLNKQPGEIKNPSVSNSRSQDISEDRVLILLTDGAR